MIKNIVTLILNDLAIAVKNKTIFLVLFIPIFVFTTLKLVDTKSDHFQKLNLGLIKAEVYTPAVIQSIKSAEDVFLISYVDNVEVGKKQLKEKNLDGLLLKTEELVVLKKESLTTLTMVESFQALQRAKEGSHSWITLVTPLQETDVQKQSLPTWILMLILLVGFVILPAQVAEEKEKKHLLSLLQTPMREIDWLLAKIFTGMILISIALVLLHSLGTFSIGINLNYIFIILIGSFCFSAYGVLLGFLCRTQASARILGVVFYLPHLLPSALADFSKKLNVVAPLLPSYQLFESIKAILFENASVSHLSFEWIYLFLIGCIAFLLSYYLIKRRYLM